MSIYRAFPDGHSSSLQEDLSRSRHTLWLGALSFEERCTASLSWLERNGLPVTEALVLEYQTPVYPAVIAEKRRQDNWQTMISYRGKLLRGEIHTETVEPYAFQVLQEIFEAQISASRADFIIFDITCMTKIHTMALAAMLSLRKYTFNWAVAYSTPENYGTLMNTPRLPRKGPGWRDIIVAPLADTALLFNESHSRGIIMTGHEADRLIVGLAELEPSGGLILNADTEHRPDLRYMSERLNRKIIRQMTRMRASNWETKVINVADFSNLKTYLSREIALAQEYRAPVILFPYGPKSLLFAAAMQMSSEYPEASWFVYPVPAAYDVNYTEGVESTLWLTPDDGAVTAQTSRLEVAYI